ncbi:MAG: pilus assembly PilX family protein [Myxococcota bacterium]
MNADARHDRKREQGAALIVAVVTLLMAAMIAVNAMQHSQEESTAGARARNTARTVHAADAGVEFAIARLSESPPNLNPFSINVDGTTVESRPRSQATPQPLVQDNAGAPPEGYSINVGSGSGFAGSVYLVNVTATNGSSAAELEVRFSRLESGGAAY